MRVISGAYKSRRLFSPTDNSVRPTADRVKESLFNILQGFVAQKTVLDLFCGSGGVGIEFLSRGAKEVVFVDNAQKSLNVCKKNLEMLNVSAKVVLSDYKRFLLSSTQAFDIIFLDPPYDKGIGTDAVNGIANGNILAGGGIIILEDTQKGAEVDGLKICDFRDYGNSKITFYQRIEI